jgi:DNA-directed RNA polymerase beta subunit
MTGTLCAAKGTTTDATIFRSISVEDVAQELESYGYNRYGYQRLYNGITGEFIDSLIFMGPTYYQKLQKFVLDTLYSIQNGPTDALTHQMLEGGKANFGGLRLGEMCKMSQWWSKPLLVCVCKQHHRIQGKSQRYLKIIFSGPFDY